VRCADSRFIFGDPGRRGKHDGDIPYGRAGLHGQHSCSVTWVTWGVSPFDAVRVAQAFTALPALVVSSLLEQWRGTLTCDPDQVRLRRPPRTRIRPRLKPTAAPARPRLNASFGSGLAWINSSHRARSYFTKSSSSRSSRAGSPTQSRSTPKESS
jgi:hypothetical protein